MMHWIKMIRSDSFHWVKSGLVFLGALLSSASLHAEERMKTNYTLTFSANDALCFVKINDMLVMDNAGMWQGQFSMGVTVSAYLQNGENTLSIAMLHDPIKRDKAEMDDVLCSAKIQNVRGTESAAAVKLIVRNGQITPDTRYYSGRYSSFGDSPRAKGAEKGFREVSQTFHARNLPTWAWTTATPVTKKDIPAVKAFYEALQNDFKKQDLTAIYKKTEGVWISLATEQGSTPQKMWNSMDYKGFFKKGYKAAPIDWNGFELNSYMNGRLFRFEKGYSRISPLLIEIDSISDDVFISTPYLSIIDGQVTAVQ